MFNLGPNCGAADYFSLVKHLEFSELNFGSGSFDRNLAVNVDRVLSSRWIYVGNQ